VLEGLDSVPWGELEHAYGKAVDIPDLIRKVGSHDQVARKEAWHELYGNLWHQGTIYEATPHAVPFFIELAGNAVVPDRESILLYLIALATGTSYNDVHQSLSIFADKRKTPAFQNQRQRELGWVKATREAVRSGCQLYAELLSDKSPRLRATAAHLLSLFPEQAAEHVAWLRRRLAAGENDELARTCIILSVSRLAKDQVDALSWLQTVLCEDRSDAVKIAAALGLAWSMRDKIPPDARTLLAVNAATPSTAAKIYEELPWRETDDLLQYLCSEALGLIRGDGDESLPELARAMNEVAPYQSIEIMRAMLERVFGGQPMPATTTADRLSEDQLFVLQAVSASKKIWHNLDGRVIVSPVVEIMRKFGLPANVRTLRAFLGGHLTPQHDDWSKAALGAARHIS
jgi:hypothetical protein